MEGDLKSDLNEKPSKLQTTNPKQALDPVEDWNRRRDSLKLTSAERKQATETLIRLLRARRLNRERRTKSSGICWGENDDSITIWLVAFSACQLSTAVLMAARCDLGCGCGGI